MITRLVLVYIHSVLLQDIYTTERDTLPLATHRNPYEYNGMKTALLQATASRLV